MNSAGMVLGWLLAAALAAAGCVSAAPGVTAQPSAGVTRDADIAGTLSIANEAEIAHARIALERARHPDVRAYAERIVSEHGTAEEKLRRMIARLNLVEGASTLAAQLERTADETADVLRTVSEAVFDRTYMDSQIATHEWLLRTVDETLMPAARREDVRAQLRMVRATALVHLERARKVLSVLAS
jgi:putative membrane protein